MKIGILSDTHGLLRKEAVQILQNCSRILHCGDIGSPQVLNSLEQIAPVTAVRGNADKEWAENLPEFADFSLAGLHVCLTHKKKDLPPDLSLYDLALFGHSHQYYFSRMETDRQRHTLLLNPGSCGPRRLHQSITMSILSIDENGWTVERIDLPPAGKESAPRTETPDLRGQIEIVMREVERGRPVSAIVRKFGMDPELTEQIARLYVTHPGVTADGILTKMGL